MTERAGGFSYRKFVKKIPKIRLVAFDFDGVFTDNMVYVFQNGFEAVRCSRADGIGLNKLSRVGVEVAVISTETNPVVTARCQKLGIRCMQGCEDKLAALDKMCHELKISCGEVAFVGNDINDLECLVRVACPIVVSDAHPDVIPCALYITKAKGGCGAVREICDQFEAVLLRSQQAGLDEHH